MENLIKDIGITANGWIYIKSVYDEDLIYDIKQIDGRKWNPDRKVWMFPATAYSDVEELVRRYGYIGEMPTEPERRDIPDYNLPKVSYNLYPFQKQGYNFLIHTKKGILADEMGLGKTVQSLTAMVKLFEDGEIDNCLIVTPSSLVDQWVAEIKKFLGIDVQFLSQSNYNADRTKVYKEWLNNGRILVLNYEKIPLKDFQELVAPNLTGRTLLILDEATKVKNFDTKAHRAIKSLEAKYKFLLTGTPLQNSPEELYSLNLLLDNNFLGSYWNFIDSFAVKGQVWNSKLGRYVEVVEGWRNLNRLAKLVRPIILRRTKEEVNLQLPEKVYETIYVSLNQQEKKFYDEIMKRLDMVVGDRDDRANVKVLGLLALMKEYCDSPMLLKEADSKLLNMILYDKDKYKFNGSKLDAFLDLFKTLDKDSQVVIFTQYAKMANLLADYIPDSVVYAGDTNLSQSVIDDFKNGKYRVLISTDKGGYGLNLVNATILINYDLPWNPAVLEQRNARIYRIGQNKNVVILNFIVRDEEMIERRVESILGTKREYFRAVIGQDMAL